MRAIIEFIVIIAVVLIARAVLTSILSGIARASSQSFAQQNEREPKDTTPKSQAGELRKDPVCGTYVAEGSALRRQVGGQTFYYCSEGCREKHALVAR